MRQLIALLALATAISAAELPRRYALVLEDAPLATQVLTGGQASRASLSTPAAVTARQKLLRSQDALKATLRQRKIAIAGSVHTLANAVFVIMSPDRAAELRALPGVKAVIPMQTLHRTLNKALDLVNTSAAWTALGGASNAGAGMKIAILDTGIDETHPGFVDPSLGTPPGFPKTGNADDATHATNKIIAVRSFVAALALGDGTPEFTRPDDLSARDHVGHGTAVAMIAGGVSHQSPVGTISGVAPKAWLGNYKIFGSPGINDTTTSDVVLQALEAAFTDGMDIALLSAGDIAAVWGPADQGATCGLASGVPCDPFVGAVLSAGLGGMAIVLPAGNDGQFGLNTINSPGDFAAAITVGATTNAHVVASTVSTPAGDKLSARLGDGPQPTAAISAPLVAVAAVDATQLGCLPNPPGSLAGKLALLTVGQCSFATKVNNAAAAGAVGVVMFNQPGGPALFNPTGLVNTGIPVALISAASGAVLNSYLSSHPGTTVTLDPATVDSGAATADILAPFSSRGPNVGDSGIKPDLVTPGASIYTAAQNYDPNGDLYNIARYAGVDGTSFAAAFAAGAAALVKQAHPAYSTGQIKSALTNTASTGILDVDGNGNAFAARVTAVGAGKLNIGSAVASTVTVVPASVSLGALTSTLPTRGLVITNTGSTTANVQFTVVQRDTDSKATVTVTPSSLSLPAGQSGSVSIALTGSLPAAGTYEGVISVAGGAVPLHIPYLYLVADGKPASFVPLLGNNFVTETGTFVDLAFRIVDRFGVPVVNMPVRFAPASSVYTATPNSDQLGIAEAYMRAAPTTGDQSFSADLLGNAGNIQFGGRARLQPQINKNGVVDGASFLVPQGFAPGSYISIFGTGLSETFAVVRTAELPLSLAGVSVSFDVPASNIHVPARFDFVSTGQITVQIPWELAGVPSAIMKVTLDQSDSKTVRADNSNLGTYQSQTVAIPIANYSPGFFEYLESSSGKTLAAAQDENFNLITSANPVARGHIVILYLNGLGPVAPGTQPASGQPSRGTAPLATTTSTPTVTIGGQPATIQFSGMTPGVVGLYQVNAFVPQSAGPGLQSVVLSIGGVTAKTTLLPVQ